MRAYIFAGGLGAVVSLALLMSCGSSGSGGTSAVDAEVAALRAAVDALETRVAMLTFADLAGSATLA